MRASEQGLDERGELLMPAIRKARAESEGVGAAAGVEGLTSGWVEKRKTAIVKAGKICDQSEIAIEIVGDGSAAAVEITDPIA